MNKNKDRENSSSGQTVDTKSALLRRDAGKKEFWLVVIMLGTLSILVLATLFVATWSSDDKELVEYSKWALTTLLGTFGAWIGAGAAYFFGLKNLTESSLSTEAALRIQQETLHGVSKPERISELALTAMNKEFMFHPNTAKKDVIDKLKNYPDYWWVPVLDAGGRGILEDIIHARVFWDDDFTSDKKISEIRSAIEDSNSEPGKTFGKLRGPSLFVKAAPADNISEVVGRMKESGAAVGVIVDEEGRPTYCFTKHNLLNVQK